MSYKSKTGNNYFGGLFSGCSKCEVYSVCGGDTTAPCKCVFPPDNGKRYVCNECPLLCRDRVEADVNQPIYDFKTHIESGRFLNEIAISHSWVPDFPLFIPAHTEAFKGEQLPIDWASADLYTLFGKGRVRDFFKTEYGAREFLKVSPQCNLIAVLNGKDKYLENLWGMGVEARTRAFEQLNRIGFSISTGPTFSVSNRSTFEIASGKELTVSTPQAHNIGMITRHNKVVEELQNASLYTIPNLYWRHSDAVELKRWADWLIVNPSIKVISRDLSLTKNCETIKTKIAELIQMLKLVGRNFHVLIVGTGTITAPVVLKMLMRAGHTGTIITKSPIHDATVSAIRYKLTDDRIVREGDSTTPRTNLILNNLAVFTELLELTAHAKVR